MAATVKFEVTQQDAVALIDLMGKLPTETGVYPLRVMMITQFNDQTKEIPNGNVTLGGAAEGSA